MIKLTELRPEWQKYKLGVAEPDHGRKLPDGTMQWGGFPCEEIWRVDTLAEAQGIGFLCPVCFEKNKGPKGTHRVFVTFADRGATDAQGSHNKEGKPSRWVVAGGSGFDDLQLTPSIQLGGGCNWHGFVGSSGAPPGYVITV